jgi:hypothetical protein
MDRESKRDSHRNALEASAVLELAKDATLGVVFRNPKMSIKKSRRDVFGYWS